MSSPSAEEQSAIAKLRSPETIRSRCHEVLALGRSGKLRHFQINDEALAIVASRVANLTKTNYPDLDVPYHSRWRHFDVGGIDRLKKVADVSDGLERGRIETELVIVSVLLDAGAGDRWQFAEPGSDQEIGRSEGLALASLQMYFTGLFSSHADQPMRVDASKLLALDLDALATGFQHRDDNPLVGLEGRLALLKSLGNALVDQPGAFGSEARLGKFFEVLLARKTDAGDLPAERILSAVLENFGSIWPSRLSLGNANLGDVWQHSQIKSDDLTDGLVPFHKLSQWLTYSLLEPVEQNGGRVTELDKLTGLPEYRNGGLLVDMGVLRPQHQSILTDAFSPEHEVIVEWRALTLALLDELAPLVRKELGVTTESFPLAKMLQGGTWAAGREVAAEKRSDGSPPIRINSDGTVF